jgi:hypothetical protein
LFLGLLDQDPDPLVRGIDLDPGFGSGSGSFYQQANIIKKPLFLLLVTSFHFLSLINDENVSSKSRKQKNC